MSDKVKEITPREVFMAKLQDILKLRNRRRKVKRKVYLGDAVYAQVDDIGRLVLTTEDGIRATNTIVLEPEVLANLAAYIDEANKGG